MNSEVKKETIVIEAVGPYGVLVDGVWLGAGDETRAGLKKGGTYNVGISEREYKRRDGKMATKREIVEVFDSEAPKAAEKPVEKKAFVPRKTYGFITDTKPRDFDAEARGKIRSLYVEAAMPSLLTTVDINDEAAVKDLMNKWVEYAMTGK